MRHLELKSAILHSKVREELLLYSDEARSKIGFLILQLQWGQRLVMPLSRPMPVVALGVEELRVKCSDGTYRVFYCVKSSKGILVLHVFEKKTQKTPQYEIETGRKRLREMLYEEV